MTAFDYPEATERDGIWSWSCKSLELAADPGESEVWVSAGDSAEALTVAEAREAAARLAVLADMAQAAGAYCASPWACKTVIMTATRGGAVQISVGRNAEALSPEGARRAAVELGKLADLAENAPAVSRG